MTGHHPHAAPPEGVLAGENVPTGSEPDAIEDTAVEALANRMKTISGYSHLTDDERRETARSKLKQHNEDH